MKTTAWTDEDRAEMRRQARADSRDAYDGRVRWPSDAYAMSDLDDHYDTYIRGVDHGAAVLGGLVGMAQAIRDRNACATCGANMCGQGGPCFDCVRFA